MLLNITEDQARFAHVIISTWLDYAKCEAWADKRGPNFEAHVIALEGFKLSLENLLFSDG